MWDTDLKGRREGCGVLRGVNTDLKRGGERGVWCTDMRKGCGY